MGGWNSIRALGGRSVFFVWGRERGGDVIVIVTSWLLGIFYVMAHFCYIPYCFLFFALFIRYCRGMWCIYIYVLAAVSVDQQYH